MYRFEEARQKHIAQYGSMLYCPGRDCFCFFMEETWKTGCICSRKPCILDDPEYIRLRATQEKNRMKREAAERQNSETERKESSAPACRRAESKTFLMINRIRQLEKEARKAYRSNLPRIGDRKLHEAMILRRKLRGKENIDV